VDDNDDKSARTSERERRAAEIDARAQAAYDDLFTHKDRNDWAKWMYIADGLMEGRRWALAKSGAQDPIGKGYNMAFSQWMATRAYARDLDKPTRNHLFWCAEHRSEIDDWRDNDLTPQERAKKNHPSHMKRAYEAAHPKPKAEEEGKESERKAKDSPSEAAMRELATLRTTVLKLKENPFPWWSGAAEQGARSMYEDRGDGQKADGKARQLLIALAQQFKARFANQTAQLLDELTAILRGVEPPPGRKGGPRRRLGTAADIEAAKPTGRRHKVAPPLSDSEHNPGINLNDPETAAKVTARYAEQDEAKAKAAEPPNVLPAIEASKPKGGRRRMVPMSDSQRASLVKDLRERGLNADEIEIEIAKRTRVRAPVPMSVDLRVAAKAMANYAKDDEAKAVAAEAEAASTGKLVWVDYESGCEGWAPNGLYRIEGVRDSDGDGFAEFRLYHHPPGVPSGMFNYVLVAVARTLQKAKAVAAQHLAKAAKEAGKPLDRLIAKAREIDEMNIANRRSDGQETSAEVIEVKGDLFVVIERARVYSVDKEAGALLASPPVKEAVLKAMKAKKEAGQ
jgi:hypothetical protein